MNTATAERELPDEIDVLKRIVIEQRARIEALTLFIAKLRRMQFGRSSERIGEEIVYGQGRAPSLAALSGQLVDAVAESLSAHFAVRSGLENAEQLRIRIDNIASLAIYRALADQLGKLGSVRQALPGLIERDTVYFDLLTDSGIDSVLQELALVPQLRPEGEPAERRYRWAAQ